MGGGKARAMADANATATAPASSGAIDYEKLGAAIAAANKPFYERLAALETASKTTATEAKPVAVAAAAAPLTIDDVKKTMADLLAQQQTSTVTAAARNAFIAEKMKGLPAAYADKLPQTGDLAQLAAAEQTIRGQFANDMKAIGVTVPNVSGAAPAAGQAAAAAAGAVDTSKMSGSQLLSLGIKNQAVTVATPDSAKQMEQAGRP